MFNSRQSLFWGGALVELVGITLLVMPGGAMFLEIAVLIAGLGLQGRAAVLMRRDRRAELTSESETKR